MGHPELAIVTGAFGYTGGYVARRLIGEGVRVRTLSRRPAGQNPLGELLETVPLDFSDPDGLRRSMERAGVLYNTYWIRYARGDITFDQAVENTKTLFEAAVRAGVGRVVHFSVTNPSNGYDLPYFRGKAQVEEMLKGLGITFSIIRPTLVYGNGDLLLNHMAWALRHFPVFRLRQRRTSWPGSSTRCSSMVSSTWMLVRSTMRHSTASERWATRRGGPLSWGTSSCR